MRARRAGRTCTARQVGVLSCALAAILLAESSRADLVALVANRDNTLYEDSGGARSNGAGTAMFVGRNSLSTDSVRRGVIAFDIAGAIPAGSTIDSVTLTLHNSASNADPADVRLHRLVADWGEGSSAAGAGGGGGSGAPATAGDATWLHTFFDSDYWSTPGGDFESVVSATEVVRGPGAYTWSSSPRWVSDVQNMLDRPEQNSGWALLGDESAASTAKRFATHEESDPALRPLLTIQFTPVPEPSAAALLLTMLTFASRRRSARRRNSLTRHP